MNPYAAPAGYYSVADVAKIRQTDHAAAWRWLSRNAGKHFQRVGTLRVISKERYRQLVMATYVADKLAKVEAKLDAIDERLSAEVMRIDATIRGLTISRTR